MGFWRVAYGASPQPIALRRIILFSCSWCSRSLIDRSLGKASLAAMDNLLTVLLSAGNEVDFDKPPSASMAWPEPSGGARGGRGSPSRGGERPLRAETR
eukprot:CAMPEP_0170408826 /NCGR_PEP_ID=MMETSP0117_2-20130122/29007_1 /TAXON_ID=400756 /ORGANISM="Durinskia baltica, Strain CSIRO CS-38" /LENGTH=98 /DNA_ID=CAMNT_0010666205 /DNA_START=348 /DNA_END=641 /DNA_ORIENTATION=+